LDDEIQASGAAVGYLAARGTSDVLANRRIEIKRLSRSDAPKIAKIASSW
jgi:hypothetical protein